MTQVIKDIVTWLKQWFYDKTEINNSEPEYIVGTHGTTTTATWTGTCSKLTEIKDGTIIFFYLTSAGANNVTLNLTLANGTTTGAKNVYFKGTTRLSTHYPINSIVALAYTTKKDSGAWYVISANDNNSYNAYEYGTVQFIAGEALTTRTLCGAKSDGKYYMAKSGVVFSTAYPLIFTNGAISSGANSNNEYMPRYDESITNTKSISLTSGKPVYLEGTSYSNGLFTISSNIVTQTLTSGRYYWLIGFAYGTSNLRTNVYETIFYYNGTNLIPVEDSKYASSSHNHSGTYVDGVTDKNTTDGSALAEIKANTTVKGTIYHPKVNSSALTGVPTANTTIGSASTFTVSQPSVNTDGHVTALTTRTYTLPTGSTSQKGILQIGTGSGNASAGNHAHGSLANGGTLNSDISSVNKVAVTDSSNNLKTISKVPFANLNITKANIAGLGIPSSGGITTATADNTASFNMSTNENGVVGGEITLTKITNLNLVIGTFHITSSSSTIGTSFVSALTSNSSVPSAYRPSDSIFVSVPARFNAASNVLTCKVHPEGGITVRANVASTTVNAYFQMIWFTSS